MSVSHSTKMKHAMCNLTVILMIWYQSILHVSARNDEKAALVFNRFHGSVSVIPPDMSSDSKCSAWASACPAVNADADFIARTALSKNPVFVKATCTKNQTIEEAKFKTNICENTFQISALFNNKTKFFEFGYEIYHGAEYAHLFKTYDMKKYFSTEDVFKELSIISSKPESPSIFADFIKDLGIHIPAPTSEIDFWYNEDRKLRFMWISLFNIEFNFLEWTPKKITYYIRGYNKWPTTWSCQKYDLVTEAYNDVDLDYLYSEENQKEIFSDLQLPEVTSDAACESTCLTKWLLIPADHFNYGSEENSVCPNMATVPIWTSTIKEVLIKVEKYLYALSQVLEKDLHIISGVKGQLELAKKNSNIFSFGGSKAKIFLEPKNKTHRVPVPNILYKIIQYFSRNCPEGKTCWRSATIIIHNDPNYEPILQKDKINKMCEDVTSSWGWTEAATITVQAFEKKQKRSPFIYVCRSDWNLLKDLLGFEPRTPLKFVDLNLKENLFDDAQQLPPQETSIVEDVLKFIQLNDLKHNNEGDNLSWRDISIERPYNEEEVQPLIEIFNEEIQNAAKDEEDNKAKAEIQNAAKDEEDNKAKAEPLSSASLEEHSSSNNSSKPDVDEHFRDA